LDQAIAIQPKAAEFWQLKAYGFYALEQKDKAEQALDKAVALNPNYFSPLLTRGVLRFEQGKYTAAEQDFNASNRLLPTKTAQDYLQKLKAGPVQ
jgi:tetratricopeptide (TPR) repeat protein